MENNIVITEVTSKTPAIIKKLSALWKSSVKATHTFLTDGEINTIEKYVPEAIKNVSVLLVALKNDTPVAFCGIESTRLEMLFVSPEELHKGIGKALLLKAISLGVNNLTVNEQNPNAMAFYRKFGFTTYKRTDLDEQGNLYPLLYMKLERE